MSNCKTEIIMHYTYENEVMNKLYAMLEPYDVVAPDIVILGTRFEITSRLMLNRLFMKKYPNVAFTPFEALEAAKYSIANEYLYVSDPMLIKNVSCGGGVHVGVNNTTGKCPSCGEQVESPTEGFHGKLCTAVNPTRNFCQEIGLENSKPPSNDTQLFVEIGNLTQQLEDKNKLINFMRDTRQKEISTSRTTISELENQITLKDAEIESFKTRMKLLSNRDSIKSCDNCISLPKKFLIGTRADFEGEYIPCRSCDQMMTSKYEFNPRSCSTCGEADNSMEAPIYFGCGITNGAFPKENTCDNWKAKQRGQNAN